MTQAEYNYYKYPYVDEGIITEKELCNIISESIINKLFLENYFTDNEIKRIIEYIKSFGYLL